MIETMKIPATVGALLRRQFRNACDLYGVKYTEHKGLIESDFVLEGTRQQLKALGAWIKEVNG